MTTFEQSQRRKWLRVAGHWFKTKAPAVPSSDDLRVFRELSAGIQYPHRIAVLGCTPTLRALANDLIDKTGEVVVVDFLREMWMSSVDQLRPHSREIFVQANWLRMGIRSSVVDLVFGDKVIDNVEPEFRGDFFDELARVLIPGGLFLAHVGLTPGGSLDESIIGIFLRWTRLVETRVATVEDASAGVWEDLLTGSAGKGPELVLSISFWGKPLTAILASPPSGMCRLIVQQFIREFGDTVDDVWADCRLDEIISAANRQFSLADQRFSSDYQNAQSQPVLLFKRR